jgi:hypothetical protein
MTTETMKRSALILAALLPVGFVGIPITVYCIDLHL